MALNFGDKDVAMDYDPVMVLRFEDGGFSVLLNAYAGPVGSAFSEYLEEQGLQGGGYSFAGFLAALWFEAGHDLSVIDFDPEAEMLSARFEDAGQAEQAAQMLRTLMEDHARIDAIIARAENGELPEEIDLE